MADFGSFHFFMKYKWAKASAAVYVFVHFLKFLLVSATKMGKNLINAMKEYSFLQDTSDSKYKDGLIT